jgi:cell division protein FtsW (lipid II flippase)
MAERRHAIATEISGQGGVGSRGPGIFHPEILEWVFTLAVIAFLVMQSAAFRDPVFDHGAGDRYQEAIALKVPLLPSAAGSGRVANICTHYGGWLPEIERSTSANRPLWSGLSWLWSPATGAEFSLDRTGACAADARHPVPRTATEDIDPSLLAAWSGVYTALAESFALPIKTQSSHLAELENRAREARADTDVRGAIESLAGETAAYREAYGIAVSRTRSLPVDCAWNYLERKYNALPDSQASTAGRTYLLVSMAAVLDGDAERAQAGAFPLAGTADAGWNAAESEAGCAALGAPQDAIKRGAETVAKARLSIYNASKSAAAEELLANAHWIFAMWAVLGLILLQIGRRPVYAHRFLPLALLAWALSAWVAKVHVEWLDDKSSHTAWLMRWGIKWPDFFHYAVGAMALLAIIAAVLPLQRWFNLTRRAPETPSSRVGYAGFVLFLGLGWWLLLDLSAAGHYSNRFHALYQQVYVFAAFVLLTLFPPLRLELAHRLGRWFGVFLLLARSRSAGLRRYLPALMYLGVAVGVLGVAALVHQSQTQLTSEIFRIWLIFGASWFFFVRGESALLLTRSGAGGVLHRMSFVWPLVFALLVPMLGLVLTDDFGPLIVMLYAASIFVGAGFAFTLFDREGYRPWLGAVAGIAVAGAWVYLATLALFSLPAPAARIAERLASVRNPFTAVNDQLAIITWFQESAPAGGYGLGAVPWCGEVAGASCRGVPRQIQSDYVFTALAGVYGKAMAVALVGLQVSWLVRVVTNHGRATRGIVNLASPAITQQAWLSWIAICWVGLTLAQLSITVAGNLGWMPLTGITFPFVSFGAWSILVNTFFLSLAINLPRKT